MTYDAGGWLEKNRDTLPEGVMDLLRRSKNPLLSLIFKGKGEKLKQLEILTRNQFFPVIWTSLILKFDKDFWSIWSLLQR